MRFQHVLMHLHFLVKLRTMVRAQSGLLGHGNDVPVPPVPLAQHWDEGPQLAATQVQATPAMSVSARVTSGKGTNKLKSWNEMRSQNEIRKIWYHRYHNQNEFTGVNLGMLKMILTTQRSLLLRVWCCLWSQQYCRVSHSGSKATK